MTGGAPPAGGGLTDVARVRLDAGTRVHLVGVGGSGMNALAHLLLQRGNPVSGSDLRGGPVVQALAAAGAAIAVGHDAANVAGADLVVVSNAVPRDNPERQAAEAAGTPVILRADLLELVMAGRTRLLVTGTHGKTTTSSMAAVALRAAGLDPGFAIGGALDSSGTSARLGSGPVFVAEADEAFRSFLRLTPDVAVVTNLEMDHHDEYADLAAYRDAFAAFLARRPADGLALLCADDPGSAGLAAGAAGPVRTYGLSAGAGARITDVVALAGGGSAFRLHDGGDDLGTVRIAVPGLHNVRNAAAAVLAARAAGADPLAAAAGLAGFTGALRRFQHLGGAGGIRVVDDYGHHPTELAATVAAARQANPDGRVVVVFQPHRWSRTRALGAELGAALAGADVVVVTAVYAAGEAPIPGVSPSLVLDGARAAGAPQVHDATAAAGLDELAAVVDPLLQPGDLVLTQGAGDITELGPRLLAARGAG